MTPDRIFYPLAALAALGLIALASVWPQGEGDRSPAPFGHTPTQQTAQAIAQARRNADLEKERLKAAAAMQAQQAHDEALVRTAPQK